MGVPISAILAEIFIEYIGHKCALSDQKYPNNPL
jgi:hypothetical protein